MTFRTDGSPLPRSAARLAARLGERLGVDVAVRHDLERGASAERSGDVGGATGGGRVAVGSRRWRGPASAASNGVARSLAAAVPCPVVLMPPGAVGDVALLRPAVETRSVVCAAGPTVGETMRTALVAARLADAFDRRLVLALATDGGDVAAARDVLGTAAILVGAHVGAARGCDVRVLGGHPGRELAALARRERADLIVVGASRHNGMGSSRLGRIATHLGSAGDTPILVLP
jgi:nucleotide-binding universal stress UspA family protein